MKYAVGIPGRHIDALACGMLVAGLPALTNHALAVTYLIRAGGRDAWLGGPLALPVALLAAAALLSLSRTFPGHSLIQYLPRLIGNGLGRVVATLYIVYFLTGAVFTLRRTTDWLVDSLLPETPPWLIAGVYLAACVLVAAGGIQVLARANQYTLPVLTFLGIVVSLLTMTHKDYRLLLPVMEQGPLPVLQVTWFALGILGEICVLGMFAQYVRGPGSALKATLVGVVYGVVTMTGPVSGAIAAMGYRQAANMPYPTFQQWLLVGFARFLERTDLLAVHQWLVGAYVRTGLLLFAAALGAAQLAPRVRWPWFLAGTAALILAGSFLPFATILDFDTFITRIYLPAGAVLGGLMPLLLWVIARLRHLTPGRDARHGAQSR